MKLTILELSAYLPYGLKWSLQGLKIFTMSGISETTLYTEEGSVLNYKKHPNLPQALFPILRPLSDLTKPITHNGETFVPIERLDSFYGQTISTDEANHLIAPITIEPYILIRQLLEWHFDVFNLIENNLAININNL